MGLDPYLFDLALLHLTGNGERGISSSLLAGQSGRLLCPAVCSLSEACAKCTLDGTIVILRKYISENGGQGPGM